MEKKLVTVFIFGMLAISISNLLLSVGVVSFLLAMSHDTGTQSQDFSGIPQFMATSNGSLPASGINNMIKGINGEANVSGANATVAPAPSANAMTGAGWPAAGPASYGSGMPLPGSGQVPDGNMPTSPSGQMPQSGQMPPSGQMPSGSQLSGGSQSLPVATQTGTGTGSGSQGLSNYMGGSGRSTTTPRPTLASTAWVNNLTSMLNSQYAASAQP